MRVARLCLSLMVLGVAPTVSGVQAANSRALLKAAQDGDLVGIRALLDAGVDVNATDKDGTTALFYAIVSRHDGAALYLLERGANPNLADKRGQTPLMYSGISFSSEQIGMFTIELVHQRRTPVTESLIRRGANVNAAAKDGRTPLMFASRAGHRENVALLLQNGANVNVTDKNGKTALMHSALATVGPLCRAGADKNIRDKKGRTVGDLAQKEKDQDRRGAFADSLRSCS